MNTATVSPARSKRAPRLQGAQIGNTNAAKEEQKDAHLHLRCYKDDKGRWTNAANSAVKRGAIAPDWRGNLAPWVVHALNRCASEEIILGALTKKKKT